MIVLDVECGVCGAGGCMEDSDPGADPVRARCGSCGTVFEVPVWEPTAPPA